MMFFHTRDSLRLLCNYVNVIIWNLIDPKATNTIPPTFLTILCELMQMSNDR